MDKYDPNKDLNDIVAADLATEGSSLHDQVVNLGEILLGEDYDHQYKVAMLRHIAELIGSMEANLEGIEDERNVYLAYFEVTGKDVAEVTRIGRDWLSFSK